MARQIGDVLEQRYRLDAQLGQGGYGIVYRARDLSAERDVAIKLTHVANTRDRARVEREIALIAGLRDPHTVKMFTYGELADGTLFIVFELVVGRDLNELVAAHGPLPAGVVVHIATQLLASLREAHLAGIVHRDVKPQNVRVFAYAGDPYCVKLLDFGIARRPDADDGVTRPGEIAGTPRYMAPEQLLSASFTPASDIYSLGVVLLELLTGREGIHGWSLAEQLERLKTGHLLAVPETESVPGLTAIIERMTARDPGVRYASAEAVIHALESAHTSQVAPVRAVERAQPARRTPPVRSVPPPRAPARSPWLVVGAVTVVALCLLAASFALRDDPPVMSPTRTVVPIPPAEPTVREPVSAERETGCDRDRQMVPGVGWSTSIIGLGEYNWLQQVPREYAPGRVHPLIVLMAREDMDEEQFLDESGFRELADEVGAIVVVPRPKTTTLALASERGLIRKMVERAQEVLCVDEARIFVVGNGSGGHGARRLSCEPWVAAAAESSARPDRPVDCERPVPYALMSPTRSEREPIDGGANEDCGVTQSLLSRADHEAALLQRNRCEGVEPTVHTRVGKSLCHEWACGAAPFLHCHIDGGQSWPGQKPRTACDGDPSEFPAARTLWEFFERAIPAE